MITKWGQNMQNEKTGEYNVNSKFNVTSKYNMLSDLYNASKGKCLTLRNPFFLTKSLSDFP